MENHRKLAVCAGDERFRYIIESYLAQGCEVAVFGEEKDKADAAMSGRQIQPLILKKSEQ